MDIFSARVKWLREKRGLTQREAAELVDMSPQGFGKVENGQREPSLEKLVLISKALDESSDFLLGITHFDKKLSKDTEYIEVMKSSMLRIEELIQEYSSKIENIKSSSDFIIKNSEHLEYNKQRFYEIRTEIISQLQEIPYVPVELINEYKEMTP